ncbi:phage replication protein O [Sporobacter termitidis DSM 10068]|uniref:Phage replication protein O n=1 Tax=Sporobacter termitidis DSM 10068 TaxID=1123282 RepID=A0A1M5Z645_9FIRM|nr:replication protein [Sporobacter termitidis]SHI19661.1 phage replication protein O [Sporobacter termitidis DSM 10068]
MADVQLKNGYTPVANEILDNLVRLPLNGTQWRIVLLLWRETYGFSRKECAFSDAYMASRLGIKRQNVHTEFKALEKAGIVKVTVQPTFSSPRSVSFCKDHDIWNIGGCNAKALQPCDAMTGMQEDAMTGMQEHDRGVMQKHCHRKQPLKQNIDDFFETAWKLYPNKKGKAQVGASAKTRLYDLGIEQMARCVKRYLDDLKKDAWRKPQNGSTFFNSGYVDYMDANYIGDAAENMPIVAPVFETKMIDGKEVAIRVN